jgi:hypothetical protein
MPRAGLTDSRDRPSMALNQAILLRSGTIMTKFAVTVAVLALGLAACEAQNEDNAVGNEANMEEAAEADTTVATNNAEMAAENALDTASNAIENAGQAVENAGEVVANQGEAHEGNNH